METMTTARLATLVETMTTAALATLVETTHTEPEAKSAAGVAITAPEQPEALTIPPGTNRAVGATTAPAIPATTVPATPGPPLGTAVTMIIRAEPKKVFVNSI